MKIGVKMEFNAETTVKELFETTLQIFKDSNESFGQVSEIKHSLTLNLKNDPDHVIEICCIKRELTESEKQDRKEEVECND